MSISVIRSFVESGVDLQSDMEYEDAVLTLKYWRGKRGEYLVLWLVIKPCSDRNEWRYKEGVRSTGFMRRLMVDIEQVARENEIDVGAESVYNEFLQPWFVRRGYTQFEVADDPNPWYYLECSNCQYQVRNEPFTPS